MTDEDLNDEAGGEDEEDIVLAELADDELVEQMHDDLYDGLKDEIVEGTEILLERGWSAEKVLNEALVEGMRIVGVDFRDGILFVPEVLLAANAMKGGMELLRPLLAETGVKPVGKMVIGTVKGDIHDIGCHDYRSGWCNDSGRRLTQTRNGVRSSSCRAALLQSQSLSASRSLSSRQSLSSTTIPNRRITSFPKLRAPSETTRIHQGLLVARCRCRCLSRIPARRLCGETPARDRHDKHHADGLRHVLLEMRGARVPGRRQDLEDRRQ